MKNCILFSMALLAICGLTAFYPAGKPAAKPDLKIIDIQDDCNLPGFYVTVTNSGDLKAGASKLVVSTDDPNATASSCLKIYLYLDVPVLRVGEQAKVKVDLTTGTAERLKKIVHKTCYCATEKPAPLLFVVVADGTGLVNESDEENNLWSDPDGNAEGRHHYINY